MQRFAMLRCGKKLRVLGVCNLTSAEFESVYPNTMHGPLVILARIAAHKEPACGNLDHARNYEFVARHCSGRFSFLLLHEGFGQANYQKPERHRNSRRKLAKKRQAGVNVQTFSDSCG